MLTHDQFAVNEAWIVVKVNDTPLFVKDDPYDMFVIMDAASAYVFGHALCKASEGSPQENDVKTIFKKGWDAKHQWPNRLILSDNSSAQMIFGKIAEENNINVAYIPLSDLTPLVKTLRDSFASSFKK